MTLTWALLGFFIFFYLGETSIQGDPLPFKGLHGHRLHAALREQLSNSTFETVCNPK